jgi:hypothetical protein
MKNLTRDLQIKPAAPGLQEYLISLPFDFPENSIHRALQLLKPLVQRRIQGGKVVHIQAIGNTVEAVLRDLARQLNLM